MGREKMMSYYFSKTIWTGFDEAVVNSADG